MVFTKSTPQYKIPISKFQKYDDLSSWKISNKYENSFSMDKNLDVRGIISKKKTLQRATQKKNIDEDPRESIFGLQGITK
jgi:hypothetical protein